MGRIESAIQTIEYFDTTQPASRYWCLEDLRDVTPKNNIIGVAKSEKVLPAIIELLNLYGKKSGQGKVESITRQRMRLGNKEIKLIRGEDAAAFLEQDFFYENVKDFSKKGEGKSCDWAITTIDKICEWAAGQKKYALYYNRQMQKEGFKRLLEDYEIVGLGMGKCTVEVACKPKETKLIEAIKSGGLLGLRKAIVKEAFNCVGGAVDTEFCPQIATDLPGIASYFFPDEYCYFTKLRGSVELADDPLIVTIVQTGQSLKDEGWVRLSDFNKEAVLVNSQTCIMRERR